MLDDVDEELNEVCGSMMKDVFEREFVKEDK